MPIPKGVILYEGPSVLDEQPIVCIATLKSDNVGTGNMIQTWIMHANINPVEATKTGDDVSVCGNCVHRHYNNGACYVNVGQAPNGVWKTYKREGYPHYDSSHDPHFEGRAMRLGSYGDPAAVPAEVWIRTIALVRAHTGYTHQVRHRNFDPRIAGFCMVSADTPRQALSYHRRGFNTFRIKQAAGDVLASERPCPKQVGNKCLDCLLCNGRSNANIVIDVHGSRKGRFVA